MSDKQLQRELAAARQIHTGMRGNSREVMLPPPDEVPQPDRGVAIRIGVAFMILVAVNVGIGLWFIVRHEAKNPNLPLLEKQMRQQIAKSIERAAATLTPSPNALGVSEIKIEVENGKLNSVADEVVAIAARLNGSATKGLQDEGRLSILGELPSNRESEFRTALASMSGVKPQGSPIAAASPTKTEGPGSTPPATVPPPSAEKKSFVVQLVEVGAKSD